MISYRLRDGERIVFWWEDGVPRIVGRHSAADLPRIAALGQRADRGLRDYLDVAVLWAITRAYSSNLGYAQVPLTRLREMAWEQFLDGSPNKDDPSDSTVWRYERKAPSEIEGAIKNLVRCGFISVERVGTDDQRRGLGKANRYRLSLPPAVDEAESQRT